MECRVLCICAAISPATISRKIAAPKQSTAFPVILWGEMAAIWRRGVTSILSKSRYASMCLTSSTRPNPHQRLSPLLHGEGRSFYQSHLLGQALLGKTAPRQPSSRHSATFLEDLVRQGSEYNSFDQNGACHLIISRAECRRRSSLGVTRLSPAKIMAARGATASRQLDIEKCETTLLPRHRILWCFSVDVWHVLSAGRD